MADLNPNEFPDWPMVRWSTKVDGTVEHFTAHERAYRNTDGVTPLPRHKAVNRHGVALPPKRGKDAQAEQPDDDTAADQPGTDADATAAGDGLDGMTAAQLRAYADDNGVDLTGATTNAARIDAIRAAAQ